MAHGFIGQRIPCCALKSCKFIGIKPVALIVNLTQPELDYAHLFGELSLLAWHRFSSWLIADALPLCESRFDYPAPQHVAEYAYLYPGNNIVKLDTA